MTSADVVAAAAVDDDDDDAPVQWHQYPQCVHSNILVSRMESRLNAETPLTRKLK